MLQVFFVSFHYAVHVTVVPAIEVTVLKSTSESRTVNGASHPTCWKYDLF